MGMPKRDWLPFMVSSIPIGLLWWVSIEILPCISVVFIKNLSYPDVKDDEILLEDVHCLMKRGFLLVTGDDVRSFGQYLAFWCTNQTKRLFYGAAKDTFWTKDAFRDAFLWDLDHKRRRFLWVDVCAFYTHNYPSLSASLAIRANMPEIEYMEMIFFSACLDQALWYMAMARAKSWTALGSRSNWSTSGCCWDKVFILMVAAVATWCLDMFKKRKSWRSLAASSSCVGHYVRIVLCQIVRSDADGIQITL